MKGHWSQKCIAILGQTCFKKIAALKKVDIQVQVKSSRSLHPAVYTGGGSVAVAVDNSDMWLFYVCLIGSQNCSDFGCACSKRNYSLLIIIPKILSLQFWGNYIFYAFENQFQTQFWFSFSIIHISVDAVSTEFCCSSMATVNIVLEE